MKIKLSPRADRDLEHAIDYLITENPAAAHKFADVLELSFNNLIDNPRLGRVTNTQKERRTINTVGVLNEVKASKAIRIVKETVYCCFGNALRPLRRNTSQQIRFAYSSTPELRKNHNWIKW